MALKKIIDSLDEVDEEDREKYLEQEDGRFMLKAKYREDDGGDGGGGGGTSLTPEEIADLQDHNRRQQKALETEREERRKLERQLRGVTAKIDELGGLDTISERITEAQELEQKRLEKKGEWETLRIQMQEQHQSELAKKDKTIQQLRGVIDREMRGRAVAEAISKANGNPNLLKPILLEKTRLVGDPEAGEDLRVEIMEGDTPLVDADGNRLTISGYVTRLRENEEYAGAFKGTGNSGGGGGGTDAGAGAGGGGGGGAPRNGGGIPPELANLKRSEMTPRQKIDVQNSLAEKLQTSRDDPKVMNEYLQIPE
jgi:hypothetical protein